MENKKKKSKLIKILKIGLPILAIGVIAYVNIYKPIKESKENAIELNILYEEVSQSADTDEDGFTSHKEWDKVYSLFEKDYSVHYSDPKKDLTKEEIGLYLKNN